MAARQSQFITFLLPCLTQAEVEYPAYFICTGFKDPEAGVSVFPGVRKDVREVLRSIIEVQGETVGV